MIMKKEKITIFIANTRDSASPNFEFAGSGQNWEEIDCLRHQNLVAPLDEIHGSKAVDSMLQEITEKIGETRIIRKLEFF